MRALIVSESIFGSTVEYSSGEAGTGTDVQGWFDTAESYRAESDSFAGRS